MAYEKLRSACERIIISLHHNDNIPSELREKLKIPLALFRCGGESALVELFSYLVYVLRERLKGGDELYFKTDEFQKKLLKLMKKYRLDGEVEPTTLSNAFAFVGGSSSSAVFNKKQQSNLDEDLNILIDNYMSYAVSKQA